MRRFSQGMVSDRMTGEKVGSEDRIEFCWCNRARDGRSGISGLPVSEAAVESARKEDA